MDKKYKLLLLDFDGVIADSLTICMEEVNRLADSHFSSIPKVHSQEDMTKVYSVQLRHSLYPFGLDDEQTKLFFDLHSQAMSARSETIEPFFDVVKGLSACKIPKLVITSSYSEVVYRILKKCRECNNDLIQAVFGREQRKTKTTKICHALELFDVQLDDALYVGDLASDILYCRDVPIDIASVGYGYHPISYLLRFSPTYTLETKEDFIDFIAKL